MRASALFVSLSSLLAATPAIAQDLEPPPTLPPGTAGSPTPPGAPVNNAEVRQEQDLKDSEKEDSGLGLEWVWANAEAGASYINMESFNSSNLSIQRSTNAGPAFGAALGVRLFFLTLGVRVRDNQFSAFNLWQVDGEIGLHMRFWRLDPYLALRGGYDFVGKLDSSSVSVATGNSSSDVTVHGFDLGAAFGLDYYLTSAISIGADLTGQVLFLKRPQVGKPQGFDQLTPQQQAQITSNPLYQNSGSSVGFGAGLLGHLGVHF